MDEKRPGGAGRTDDARRFPRHVIEGIEGSLRSPGDVEVCDLSLAGMSIETANELVPGESYFLELRHRGKVVSLEVRVKWVEHLLADGGPNEARQVYRGGVSFVDVYRDTEGGIWDWIFPDDQES